MESLLTVYCTVDYLIRDLLEQVDYDGMGYVADRNRIIAGMLVRQWSIPSHRNSAIIMCLHAIRIVMNTIESIMSWHVEEQYNNHQHFVTKYWYVVRSVAVICEGLAILQFESTSPAATIKQS